ncbi:MAG TPA: transposase [Burkholderiales bacterium]|nr:transposase [Burkholderiales bacterium]
MPRRLRISVPDVAMHIVQRGNNRSACFFRESDYLYYLLQLRTLAADIGCSVHAYCLMTNHVHLLITPRSPQACTALMKHLSQRHAQYVNRTYVRTGSLWDGRFRSCLTESRRYVLACYRYIELNPVRAGMVDSPGGYAWSSHAANARGARSDLIAPHPEYLALGTQPSSRYAAYARLFEDALDPSLVASIRESTNGGYALGSDQFRSEISRALGRRVARGRPGRPCASEKVV